jgi:ABC-type phosphate transport system substrate-binding protein
MRNKTPRAGLWLVLLGFLVTAIPLVSARPAAATEEFVVIVNAANPVTSVKSGQLSSLFLKKLSQWGGGLPAVPVDLGPESPVRESFSRQIHRKGTAAVKAYWQQMIFSGREVPPPEKASAREVVAFVSANRGGVGYVPAGTALGSGVKTVEVKP